MKHVLHKKLRALIFTALVTVLAVSAWTFVEFRVSALTCLEVAQRIKVLDQQLRGVRGCDDEPTGRPTPPRPLPPTGGPPKVPCVPNSAAVNAWHRAHDAEYKSLVSQLGVCNKSACPAIAPLPGCRCPKNTKNCPCEVNRDSDGDGISDREEADLIARFSPFLRFTKRDVTNGAPGLPNWVSEPYRPARPLTYLSHSRVVSNTNDNTVISQVQLQAQPAAILDSLALGSSNLLKQFHPTNDFGACVNDAPKRQYHIDPVDDEAHAGESWDTVKSTKHVGLYAHVSPLTPRSVQDLSANCPRTVNDSRRGVIPPSWYESNTTDKFYKIEYYQFFGYNNAFAFAEIGNHEGDWAIVTLVYDKSLDDVVAVSHWAHGYEMRFDLKDQAVTSNENDDEVVGHHITFHGSRNEFASFQLAKLNGTEIKQDEPEKAQNNEVSFLLDDQKRVSHPIVFVEFGAHEFWPTPKWGFVGAPEHWGNDKDNSYLTQDIPNLGEIEHPMGAEAEIILWYDGSWGYVNVMNDPPPGPALHKSWNWFVKQRNPILCSSAE